MLKLVAQHHSGGFCCSGAKERLPKEAGISINHWGHQAVDVWIHMFKNDVCHPIFMQNVFEIENRLPGM